MLKSMGMHSFGMLDTKPAMAISGLASIRARAIAKPSDAGNNCATIVHRSPIEQLTVNGTDASTLAIGLASGSCPKVLAEYGSVTKLEASVKAMGSPRYARSLLPRKAKGSAKSPENRIIPSVEPAESTNDAEMAHEGSEATNTIMHSASALKGDDLLFANGDTIPKMAMIEALIADMGIPEKAR